MRKKSSLYNVKHFFKSEERTTPKNNQNARKQKAQLPKILHPFLEGANAKKTLLMAIKTIEEYIAAHNKKVPEVVFTCLDALKAESEPGQATCRSVRKTEANESSYDKQNNNSNFASQVFSVNRNLLKKVGSKELFNKVNTFKYSSGDLVSVNQKEIIAALKCKVKENQNLITQLHGHIQELKEEMNLVISNVQKVRKMSVIVMEQKQIVIKELDLQKVSKQRAQQVLMDQRNKLMLERQINKELQLKVSLLTANLAQRESQIVSIWQTMNQRYKH